MQLDVETVAHPEEPSARESDSSTRDRVLQLVVAEGPISAAQLGRKLSLTAAAVRRHLDTMTEQGIVEVKNISGRSKGAGRPSRRYVISSAGQQVLGNDYLNLVHTALSVMDGLAAPSSELDADGIGVDQPDSTDSAAAREVAREYFSHLEERYAAEQQATENLEERTEKLADFFNDHGFAGFTRLVGRDNSQLAMQSSQLCQGQCPIREIAAAHPVFCEEETMMIGRLLDVDVRRLSTQAAGAHVCTTHVPVGREKLAEERRVRAEQGDQTSATAALSGRKRIVISPRQQERLS